MSILRIKDSHSALLLVGCGLLLSLFGIAVIHSALASSSSAYERGFYLRQTLWLFLSLGLFAAVVSIPVRLSEVFAYVFYALVIVLLIGLLLKGSSGAARWYNLGFMNLQVSEVAKLAVIFVLARYLSYSRRPVNSMRRFAYVIMLVGVPMLLVLTQPDLGTALVFVALLIVILFWSGLPLTYMILLVSPGVSLIASSHWLSWLVFFALVLLLLNLIKPGIWFSTTTVVVNLMSGMIMPFVWNKLHDYQKMRILVFLDPGRDPLGAGYQIIQSKVAIGSGGIWGKGYMAGTQTSLAFIPERHTDFIFSVLGEEFGFWGGLIVLTAFAALLLLGVRVAFKARNKFTSLIVIGGVTVLAFQYAVNIGMALGLMPVTGLPLPFVSYGGSSLLLSWTILGMLVNAELNWQEY